MMSGKAAFGGVSSPVNKQVVHLLVFTHDLVLNSPKRNDPTA